MPSRVWLGYGMEVVRHSDAMWLASETLAKNKTPAINVEKYVSLSAASNGAQSSVPSGPRLARYGCGQGRVAFPVAFMVDGIAQYSACDESQQTHP